MTEATDRVLALLSDACATEELVDLLTCLDEAERKALARPVRAAVKARGSFLKPNASLGLAVLGCVEGARAVATTLVDAPLPRAAELLAVRVLAARRPAWLADLPAALLHRNAWSAEPVRLVRAMVGAGLVETPDLPEYGESLVRGIYGSWGEERTTVLAELRAAPALLTDVWIVLSTERAGRLLRAHDEFASGQHAPSVAGSSGAPQPPAGGTWRDAITTLAAEGLLERDRLLDCTLAAFLADRAAVDVTWFVGLHDALAPTTDEVERRQATYARLLTVAFGPAVRLGLRALGGLLAEERLDVDVLLQSAGAPLARPEKGTAWTTLTLLTSVSKKFPSARERISEVLSVALEHPQADVRERAQDVLRQVAPERSVEVLTLEPVAPARGQPWAPAALEPTGSPDEVADLLAQLIEEADDPVEVERVLDGVLRWVGRRPRTADVLAVRAAAVLSVSFPGAWTGEELRADLALTALVWLGKAVPGPGFRDRSPFHIALVGQVEDRPPPSLGRDSSLGELVSRRIHEVCVAVHEGNRVLLSFPTATDGSLDAAALNRRVGALPRTAVPMPIDAAVALLRVAPERYGDLDFPALHRTGRYLATQVGLLARYRPAWSLLVDVEGDEERRNRRPWRTERPQPAVMWRDDAALPAGLTNALSAVIDRSDPLSTFGAEVVNGEYASRFEQVTACWPLLLPHLPDVLAAAAHPRLRRAMAANRSGVEPLLDALGRSCRPLGPPVHSALLLGLSARNGVERTHAVDAVVDVSAQDAIDGSVLGGVLATLLRDEAVVGTRVAAGLAEVFRAEPATAGILVDCLAAALDAIEGRRDAHLYVDLLADAAEASGRVLRLPDGLAAAARSTAKTQLARAARRVPQPASPPS